MASWGIDLRPQQILTIRRILEDVRVKNLEATILFVDFTKAYDFIHREKMEQIQLAFGLPKETVAAIIFLYIYIYIYICVCVCVYIYL